MLTPYLAITVLLCIAAFLFRRLSLRQQVAQDDKVIGNKHGCLPPPVFKNQWPLGVDRLEQLFRANAESRLMEHFLGNFRQMGSTFMTLFLGNAGYATMEPANLEALLSTNFNDYSMGPRREVFFPMFGDGIFTQDGQAWKDSRQILRPQFMHRQYEDLSIFKESVDDLIEAIDKNLDSEGVVDLQPLFFGFTLDTTTAFLFGESVRSLKASTSTGDQTFAEAFNIAQDYIAKRMRLVDLYWLIGGKKFRKACRTVHEFADSIIDRNLSRDRTAGDQKQFVFLDSLAEHVSDRIAIRGQIINILIAGRDTTACLLSWTFFLLVRHREVLQKLRAEIKRYLVHDSYTRKDLLDIRYLQNVLKETLRLYPSVPVNTRSAVRTTILPTGGGPDGTQPVLIPKSTGVAFSVYAMHRRPDLYGMDAELFRPERWDEPLPMDYDSINAKWGYLPFNGGPRVCLGMDFALTEASYAVARILQEFPRLGLPPNEKVDIVGVEKQTMTLVVSITDGCKVQMTNYEAKHR
ncbi:cytochrome P450 alkane hydroxylase [Microthyrium microscopicum]|uniref:Cytochrome P450 alkane hydroxylase n=1 Tax=Microthyrium microscopicum TaxID=703497 RepID=A0A6A6U910_9PEZI|nr:cytochrome P450 alkane hydroxylase [Microthyrium microscopicum]